MEMWVSKQKKRPLALGKRAEGHGEGDRDSRHPRNQNLGFALARSGFAQYPAARGFSLGRPAKWHMRGGFAVCAGLLRRIGTSVQQTTTQKRQNANEQQRKKRPAQAAWTRREIRNIFRLTWVRHNAGWHVTQPHTPTTRILSRGSGGSERTTAVCGSVTLV